MEVPFLNLKLQHGVIKDEVIIRLEEVILNNAFASVLFVQKIYK